MPQVDIPVVNKRVNPTGNPSGTAKTMVWVVVGFSFLFFLVNLGQEGGSWLTNMFSNITGVGAGGSSGITESVGGGF